MTRKGRPIRFIVTVLFAWTGLRVAILWPQTGSLPAAIKQALPVSIAKLPRVRPSGADAPVVATLQRVEAGNSGREKGRRPFMTHPALLFSLPARTGREREEQLQFALVGLVQFGSAERIDAVPVARTLPPHDTGAHPSGWRGSAWLYLHGPGRSDVALASPRLGGSQAGIRLLGPFADAGRVAFAARASTPVTGEGAEAAAGVSWRPADLPVEVIAEQRFGLDGQPGGPAAAIVGGSGPEPVGGGFDLETYGEAGAVFRASTDVYAAGAARLSHRVADVADGPLSLGLGAWASTQRDASRVDIGPSVTLPLPVSSGNVRLALDWRQQLAGEALPRSGPALTLGADF